MKGCKRLEECLPPIFVEVVAAAPDSCGERLFVLVA